LLPPAFLDYRLDGQGGYDVPRLPYSTGPTACATTRVIWIIIIRP
jgi:hypothetical protein